jgi:hypothetical protein
MGESTKEVLDIDFGSACDDDLQPRSLCGCIDQDLQETWATLSIATLVVMEQELATREQIYLCLDARYYSNRIGLHMPNYLMNGYLL